MKKIEELSLYNIQLEKTNQQQKEVNKQPQAEIDELKQLVMQLAEKK